MAEPMDEDSTSQIPRLNLGQDAPSETMAAASGSSPIGSRTDGVQKLLEIIVMSFRYEFDSLPSEAQQAYSRFQQNKSYPEFAAELKRLLLHGHLYTFMRESTAFLHAATDLFDSRYPHLGLRELLDEKEGRRKNNVFQRHSSGRPSKSRRRAKGAAGRHDQTQRMDAGSEPSANIGLARTLTTSSRSHQLRHQQGRVLDWTRVEPPPFSQAPQVAAGPSTAATAMNFEAAGSTRGSGAMAKQGTQPVTGQRPLTPGFMISTRSRPESRDDHEPGTEISGGPKPLAEFNAAWLRNYIDTRGGHKADFSLYPYKGWKIEQPKVLLYRAKNFLADEDIDRTLDWSQKFAELVEYFSYLLHNWQGEDWGVELQEVIDMLHTHWLFEQYHYGQPKLNLNFDTEWPKESKRLPPLPGVDYIVGKRDEPKDDKGERRLLLNKIRPAIDVHYKLHSTTLKKYVNVYASEVPFFWGFGPDSVSPRRELVKIENDAFEKCVFSDMSTTATNIEENESKFKLDCDKEHFSSDALRTFAKLRGTRRAALQQTLNHLDNAENMAVCNVWRTFILPTPKVPEKPDAGILLPVMQVANIPDKEARDPFSYTLGHKWFVQAERYWADWTRKHSIKEAHGHRLWEQREEPVMDLPLNFRSPFVQDNMDHEMKKTFALLKKCEALWKRISIQKRVTKRPFMSDVVSSILKGLAGKHWHEMEMPFKAEDFMPDSQELAYIRPKEEDFLRLLGERSVDFATLDEVAALDPEFYKYKDGPRSKLFQQRVENVFYGKGTKNPIRYDIDDFLVEINRDCGGPVQRWRFSREEAIEELELLEEKLLFRLEGHDYVFYPEPNLHPEQRVRWLDTDQDMDAYMQAMKSSKDKASSDNDGANKDKDEIETISTDVSIPESEEFGDYMFGLPKIENLRSWHETFQDDDDEYCVDDDMPKTLEFYKRLGFRLGKTILDLRAKHETDVRRLTPLQREINNRFLKDIVRFWEGDAVRRPNEPESNPNKVGGDQGDDRPTPYYRDVIKTAEPEAYDKSWQGLSLYEDHKERETALELIRKGIIREARENKSMLFPSRIDRHINEKGETVELPPRREPVWSFAHPERRGKVPRFWDINRWPLHLQPKPRGGGNWYANDMLGYKPRIELTRRLLSKEVRSLVAPAPTSSVKPKAQRERKPEPTSKTSPDVTKKMDMTKDQSQSIPGLGEKFAVTFRDMAQSRRTFRPGPPQYWLGDTPLQRKAIEKSIRSGIESAQTPTWRQRLAALFGRREEIEDDPTALPDVHPRDIPKSRPRSESSEEQDDESAEEDMPDVEEVVEGANHDVEMENAQGIATRFAAESEAGPSRASPPLGSPMVAVFSPGPPLSLSQRPETPTAPAIHPTTEEYLTGTAERAFRQLGLEPWSNRPRSRPLESHRLNLTIEEPTQAPHVEPERNEEEEALHRALYESD
ncbi:hypothetical protein FSARC_54 [Fusarium sarcochroum]|uniref:Uncharacterized protein n=1 Tax=Fusarium sarcochroum TaxID=1208366 RepID=A0A8H4UC91_9HYPO|nr:hypothetical protein FSARC_54 [Fusarium sarcochroum]